VESKAVRKWMVMSPPPRNTLHIKINSRTPEPLKYKAEAEINTEY
jgi:hypothetical protein